MTAAERPFATLQLGRHEAVATVTLNRPQALNALDPATLRELARAVREIRRDAGVRAVILTGAGPKAFSAGADIAAMADMEPHEGHSFSQLGHDVMARIEALAVPVVAAVNGVALGGGLELALACDFIVAGEGARFGQPEINLGLVPGFGGTQRLVRRIGQGRTRDLVYLGKTITAGEALRIGLVDRVVPAAELPAAAASLAAELAAKAPIALAQAKRTTAVAADTDLGTGCRFEIEAFATTFATDDRREGLRAFRERRAPRWTGR
jgi:enoyl-CoA hydratase